MANGGDSGAYGCISLLLIGSLAYWASGAVSKCSYYASEYSCGYVKNRAHYDVYYWRNIADDDPNDERLIASSIGLEECRGKAIEYAASI
jgi:hypothetical protein